MRNLKETYDSFEENLLFSLLAFSVGLIFFQVVMRYVFHASLSWSEELARYLFVWYTWMGTSYAVVKHRHIRIEVLSDFLNGKSKLVLELVSLTVWCAFSIFLAYKGWHVVNIIAIRGQLSAALQIPMAVAYAAVPVGSLLMSIRLLGEIIFVYKSFVLKGAEE